MKSLDVSCVCGAVALRIAGEPTVQVYCHCDDCQAAHGGAYVLSSVYPASAVEIVRGQLTAMVLKTTQRMRCAVCNTHLFTEVESAGMRSVNAYLLPTDEFKPQFHVQCQHAVLPVVDGLPHFKAFPAAFGGSDERVAW